MSENSDWIWVEKIFRYVPTPYPLASLAIGTIIYLIFKGFSEVVTVYFSWDLYHNIQSLSISITIAFQLAAAQYLTITTKSLLINLNRLYARVDDNSFYISYRDRFAKSRLYYVVVALVVLPLMVVESIRILEGDNLLFYKSDPTFWSLMLDIYNHVVVYLSFVLLSIFIWIILNISWALNQIARDSYRNPSEISLITLEDIELKGPIRETLSKIVSCYFIALALEIISYITPFSIISYETIFLISLLLIGMVFYYIGVVSVRKISFNKIKYELDINHSLYSQYMNKILSLRFVEPNNNDIYDVICSSVLLDDLRYKHIQIMHLDKKGYDLGTIAAFISTFILPIITILQNFL